MAAKKATKKKTTAKKKAVKKTVKKTTAKKTTRKTTARKAAPKRKVAAKKRPAAKKAAPKRKPAAKKAAPKKAAPKKKPAAIGVVKGKPMTKSQLHSVIADHVGITKKQAAETFEVFTKVVHAHLKNGSVGKFKFNGLINAKVVKKPARKARKGINPFTGEEIMIKAKPAYKSVKVSALKALKEMAGK